MVKTNFSPIKHGFHFPNKFNREKNIEIPELGEIDSCNRSGGMAYSALDYYFTELPVPSHTLADFPRGVPVDGEHFTDYILERLHDSFLVPSAVKFITWTEFSDNDTWIRKGLTSLTKEEEFPKLCSRLDRGIPTVLGLIPRDSNDAIFKNRQVVAYGYAFNHSIQEMKLFIYDSNYPDKEIILFSNTDNPNFFSSSGEIWRGFFVHDYTPIAPTYIDIAISRGIRVSSTHPNVGGYFDCRYTVKNYGNYPARFKYLYLYVRGPEEENFDYFLGSDENTSTISPNEEREIFKSCDSFGSTAGRHTIGVLYRSAQDEWITLPRNFFSKINTVAVDVSQYNYMKTFWSGSSSPGCTSLSSLFSNSSFYYLSYKEDSGEVAINHINSDGRGINTKWISKWDTGSTSVITFSLQGKPFCLSYNVISGSVSIGSIKPGIKGIELIWASKWASGLTYFMPFVQDGKQYYLAYKAPTGDLLIDRVKSDGCGVDNIWSSRWSSGWSSFVSFLLCGSAYFLAYKVDTGEIAFCSIRPNGCGIDIVWSNKWSPGWTSFMPFILNGTTCCVVYNSHTGDTNISSITRKGLASIWQGRLLPGWTSMIPFTLNWNPCCLSYNSTTGAISIEQFNFHC